MAVEGDSPPITTEGLRRFQCIGGKCEYTCCSGWTITVDQAHYEALKSRMSRKRAWREEFKTALVQSTDVKLFSTTALRPNGDCTFLAEDRLCSLQARFGEEALPDTCHQYPRILGNYAGARELWGALSCPEIARKSLLVEDGMDLAPAPEAAFARQNWQHVLKTQGSDYQRHRDAVRGIGLELLSLRAYPISTRLFLLAYLGKRTEAFFYRDAAMISGEQLQREIDRLRDPEVIKSLHEGFEKLEVPRRVAAAVVVSVLQARLNRDLGPTIAKVLLSFVAEGVVRDDGHGVLTAEPEPLWDRWCERRRAWEAEYRPRSDLYFENHAKSFWLQEWHTGYPNLLSQVHDLLVRSAVARFLLFGHPNLLAVAEGAERSEKERVLDATIVEVISHLTRAIEHDSGFVRRMHAVFAEGKMQDFAHAAILARA
jgi:lysine-N-methylase